MAGGRKLGKAYVLLIAGALAFVACWLPGGLFPLRQVAAARATKTAGLAGFFERETAETVAAAEFRLDVAGRLLLPRCGGGGGAAAAAAAHTLLRVRCVGAGRAVAHLHNATGARRAAAASRTRAVGLVRAATAAAAGQRVGLLCGPGAQELRVVPRCLPLLARAMRELAPRAYSENIRAAWDGAARAGAPLCCEAAEERKPLELVDVSKCGVQCAGRPPSGAGAVRGVLREVVGAAKRGARW